MQVRAASTVYTVEAMKSGPICQRMTRIRASRSAVGDPRRAGAVSIEK